jgi:meiotically up-regulated gene 157 (Mug157) protein
MLTSLSLLEIYGTVDKHVFTLPKANLSQRGVDMNRRNFMREMALAVPAMSAATVSPRTLATVEQQNSPPAIRGQGFGGRPLPADRRFISRAVEETIARVKPKIANAALAQMFENCYPNTLDTTVTFSMDSLGPDAFVITGDIPAMWLRDSTAQVMPYLGLIQADSRIKDLIRGVIRRQAHCISIDPYANAFYDSPKMSSFQSDQTRMLPGVHERKWEVDSLCYPVRLSYKYWQHSGDQRPFDQDWARMARLIVDTFRVQQRLHEDGPYRFARTTTMFYDNSPNTGLGNPTRKIGLIHSSFRPSDDACLSPFLIPSNMFARQSLLQLAELSSKVVRDDRLAMDAQNLADTLGSSLQKHAVAQHPVYGSVIPYEIDGFGNALLMDDANAPGLLSLPYLDCCNVNDALYQRTRAFVLSVDNPFFFKGKFAEGVGGPHVGPQMVWPLSIIMRALTTYDKAEILSCLKMLLATDAGTGFMHESFDPDNPHKYTRPWFAWCNSLFGELIVRLADSKPELLAAV